MANAILMGIALLLLVLMCTFVIMWLIDVFGGSLGVDLNTWPGLLFSMFISACLMPVALMIIDTFTKWWLMI